MSYGLAGRGWCKGDPFIVSSIAIVVALILLFVFLPVSKVLSAAMKDAGTTKSDVAQQLDLYTSDLDALIFGLILAPVSDGRRVPNARASAQRRTLRSV